MQTLKFEIDGVDLLQSADQRWPSARQELARRLAPIVRKEMAKRGVSGNELGRRFGMSNGPIVTALNPEKYRHRLGMLVRIMDELNVKVDATLTATIEVEIIR